MEKFIVLFISYIAISTVSTSDSVQPSYLQEQPRVYHNKSLADMNVEEIVDYYGYKLESHKVETSDGYILTLHRITGKKKDSSLKKKPPVLLQHGLLCSSVDWIIIGPGKAPALLLVDAGYDVWIPNSRGTEYSREHKYLSANESDYWNFSWHEMGIYDLPASIDYILNQTSNEKLIYIGHSQGSTAFFVMASEVPEYNKKIHVMYALAPVVYSSHMYSPFFQFLAKVIKPVQIVYWLIGYENAVTSIAVNLLVKLWASIQCNNTAIDQWVCSNPGLLSTGYDLDHFDMSTLPAIMSHNPAGASVKQLIHYTQLVKSGFFRQFDNGVEGNLKMYKSIVPPSYQITKITAPVYVFYSANDWAVNTKDVEELFLQLPNATKILVKQKTFYHADFVYGKNVKEEAIDEIISLMSTYTN